ncbi:MAG: hypothetical protein JKY65_09620 [Planctomycetes bacterium]|nr:hypothetical protein [Planctomycetota bacterium]
MPSRLFLLLLLLPLAPACVEREFVIETSEPAEVFVDGDWVGSTSPQAPVRVAFDDYGTRQVTARAPGFLPSRRAVELDVPWYQVFPLGLFSDVLWPGTIRDVHSVRITLERRGEPRPASEVAREARSFAEGDETRE